MALAATPALAMHGVLDRVKEANERNDSLDFENPMPKNIVQAAEDYQGGPFWVLARKGEIGRYPCGKCHGKKASQMRDGAELAHGDIVLSHGKGPESPQCVSCHDKENRDLLTDRKDSEIDFDHSYRLCGQCHFRQKSDWIGGAHGKRHTYWAGKRVVWNCATCHDPHSPRFEKRWPVIYSTPLEK